MLSLVVFLAVFGFLVVVHELGHFIAAKRLGVRVEVFSLGFGPRIFSVKIGGTEYVISAIFFGGYVKLGGDDPGGKITGARWEFLSRGIFDRFQIVIAGVVLNYIIAYIIFSVIFMFGNPTATTEVGALLKGYPAEKQGILVGDTITSVNGKDVKYWEDMTAQIYNYKTGTLALKIKRGDSMIAKEITPVVRKTKDIFGQETSIALIGVRPSQKFESVRHGILESFGLGFNKLMQLTAITYKSLWMIVTGKLSFRDSMSGPIGIFIVTGQMAKLGFIYIVNLVGVLSASLAIFNVLPLPILDGGHILFLIVEKFRGKPLSLKAQENIANVGLVVLVSFTLFVFYNDIIKFGIADKAFKIFKK